MAKLVDQMDHNNDGEIDFDEFVCCVTKKLWEGESAEEELVQVFKRFDQDGDNEIGPEDLTKMMNELGYQFTEDDARDMIWELDVDQDGKINFLEFIQTMMYDTMDLELMKVEKGLGKSDETR